MEPAAAENEATSPNRRSVRVAVNNARLSNSPAVITTVDTLNRKKKKKQSNKKAEPQSKPEASMTFNSTTPSNGENVGQNAGCMANLQTFENSGSEEIMVGHTSETSTKTAKLEGPNWDAKKRQHATGLRKVEDLTSDVGPEHPGTTVSNYPEEAFIVVHQRRIKTEWLNKTKWDDRKKPIKPHKRNKITSETSTGNETFESASKMQQYQKDAFLFKAGFGGRIIFSDIAANYGYSFVVPGHITFCMLASFKTKEVIDEHRRRMTKIQSAKTVYYYQLHWREGFKNTSASERTWRQNTLMDNATCYTLEGYLKNIGDAIKTATGNKSEYKSSLMSLLETEQAVHQPGHIDDATCEGVPALYQPWILHQPLCAEGRTLQIWILNEKGKLAPQMLHIPFGSACVLRGDVYHGGCYGSSGNIGFHAQLNPKPADGKYLKILAERNERLRETDIKAEEVNDTARTGEQVKFTQKYLRNMKKSFNSDSFWIQRPEENANWSIERLELRTA
jgi:hypothetical protein